MLAFQLQAIVVNNTAGALSQNVTDLSVTSLTVTGAMNAVDFYFIADKLTGLTEVDLTQVTVVACKTSEEHYCHKEFADDELPIAALSGTALTQVRLPSTLKTIGKAAFAGCDRLTTVVLPSTLDIIADYAFAGCSSLDSITLPASVTTVGAGAFMRCTSLSSFAVESGSHLLRLNDAALMDCPALTVVTLGADVKGIGERAFAGTGLANLDLAASSQLTDIGDWAMVLTPLTQVSLPDGLKSMGDGVFLYDKDLVDVSMGPGLTRLNDFLFAGTALNGELVLKGVTSLGDYALYNVDGLSVVELPVTLSWLGTRSMAGMTGLTSLKCKASVVPELGSDVWQGVDQPQVLLVVPPSAKSLYQAAAQWQDFMFESGWLRGDVNNDGEVNIADISSIVNIILGAMLDDDTMRRADVNEDGEINILDIDIVITIILTAPVNASARVDADERMHIDDLSISPGEQRTLTVTLDRASAYNAMQCDISLPAGLSLLECRSVHGYEVENGSMEANTTRSLTYSMDKRQFDGGSQAVLVITVLADASLASESQITLSNIVLANDDNEAKHIADCVARVSNTSGIDDLTAAADKVWTEGRTLCIDTRRDGIAQVVAINGTVREVELVAGVNRCEMEQGFYVVVVNGQGHKIAIK